MIATPRLVLVPLGSEHADALAETLADERLHAFTGGAPLDRAAMRARVDRLVAGSGDPAVQWRNWVIRLPDGAIAGTVQATVTGGSAEVAWVVGVPWQGRGLGGDAAKALVTHLRADGIAHVVAHIHPDHRASQAVARAAGLHATDELRDGEVRWTT